MLKKSLIAIIDDDIDDSEVLSAAFTNNHENVSVVIFDNGNDFLEYLNSGAKIPAFVITDLYMPVMTGLEIIIEMKKNSNTAAIPTAIISSTQNTIIEDAANALGSAYYFIKPNTLAEFDVIADTIMTKF